MALEDVVDAVRQDFIASGCPASVLFGHRFLPQHDAPPRVVFAATTDSYEPPLAQGNAPSGLNPRAFYRRIQGFDAHIWGAAPEQPNPDDQYRADWLFVAKLINQVVLSLYRVAPGNNQPLTGSFGNQADYQNRGLLYVLKGTAEVPIVDIDYPSWGIDSTSKTWTTESGVVADITVDELNPADQTVMGSITFSNGEPA